MHSLCPPDRANKSTVTKCPRWSAAGRVRVCECPRSVVARPPSPSPRLPLSETTVDGAYSFRDTQRVDREATPRHNLDRTPVFSSLAPLALSDAARIRSTSLFRQICTRFTDSRYFKRHCSTHHTTSPRGSSITPSSSLADKEALLRTLHRFCLLRFFRSRQASHRHCGEFFFRLLPLHRPNRASFPGPAFYLL